MSIDIKVPTLPESVADAQVLTWHKKPGDAVSRDEVLVEVETDKVVLEVPAPEDGVMGKIVAAEGETVLADQVIGQLEAAGSAAAPTPGGKAESTAAPEAAVSAAGESVDIKVPTLPESVADAQVLNWHKKPGDAVERDEVLVEVETDKVVMEVPAPESGVMGEIVVPEGETVLADQVIGRLSVGASASAGAAAPAAQVAASGKADAQMSLTVRRMLSEHDMSPADVQGSGPNGRIMPEDVEKQLAAGKKSAGTAPVAAAATAAPATPAASAPAPATSSAPPVVAGSREEQRVPMTRLRARIAERLLEATQTTAMLTTFNEVNMHAFIELRNRYKDDFEKAHGIKLGFMSIFLKAATEALKRFPDVNALIDGNDIVYHGYCDIGVAVSSDRGLVVPVVRNTENMSLADMEKAIADFAARARDGKLTIDEMTGGTFTVSNGGVFGSLLSTPILNPPQSAILGMHATQQRPVAENGQVVIRPMMYLALSYDHRIIDGKGAVTFLKTIKEIVENPERLVLGV